jgi:hypothetical protein
MKIRNAHTLVLLFFYVSSSLIMAQGADVEFFKRKYPNKAFVYLMVNTDFEIRIKDNKPLIVKKYKEQRLLLTDAAKSADTRKISTNEFIEVKNLKARVFVPNGKKYDKLEVADVSLTEEGSDGSFYNGEKQYVLKFPSTLPGNILEIEYEEVYNEPRFFGSVFISEYYPIISSRINIKMPASANLTIKNVNTQALNPVFNRKQVKSDSIFSWSFDTLAPITFEPYSPNLKYYSAYILLKLQDYKSEDGTVKTVLKNTDDVYKWYSELMKNLNKTEDGHLKSITDSVTMGAVSDMEKVKKIFYWVQDKIAYVAYENGLGGYIPREAPIICKRRFGDCKDMASLIVKMGQLANVKIYHTWIGTRDIPYVFSEFPSPFCANHMIATYIDEKGNYVFLDATGKNSQFGVPTAMIQGKEAFIGTNEKEYKLVTVPTMPSAVNNMTDSIICSINGNKISGYGYFIASGYSKSSIMSAISNKPVKELKEYFSAVLNKGNNKFTLDSFSIMQQSKELPLKVYYKFTLPDYATTSANNTFVNLNFDKDYLKDMQIADRTSPIEYNFCFTKKICITLNLNPNESVDFLPNPGSEKNSVGGYVTKYVSKERSVYFENELFIDQFLIGKKSFPDFGSLATSYSRVSNKSLSILKTK